jgi:hypothetical protein
MATRSRGCTSTIARARRARAAGARYSGSSSPGARRTTARAANGDDAPGRRRSIGGVSRPRLRAAPP